MTGSHGNPEKETRKVSPWRRIRGAACNRPALGPALPTRLRQIVARPESRRHEGVWATRLASGGWPFATPAGAARNPSRCAPSWPDDAAPGPLGALPGRLPLARAGWARGRRMRRGSRGGQRPSHGYAAEPMCAARRSISGFVAIAASDARVWSRLVRRGRLDEPRILADARRTVDPRAVAVPQASVGRSPRSKRVSGPELSSLRLPGGVLGETLAGLPSRAAARCASEEATLTSHADGISVAKPWRMRPMHPVEHRHQPTRSSARTEVKSLSMSAMRALLRRQPRRVLRRGEEDVARGREMHRRARSSRRFAPSRSSRRGSASSWASHTRRTRPGTRARAARARAASRRGTRRRRPRPLGRRGPSSP